MFKVSLQFRREVRTGIRRCVYSLLGLSPWILRHRAGVSAHQHCSPAPGPARVARTSLPATVLWDHKHAKLNYSHTS